MAAGPTEVYPRQFAPDYSKNEVGWYLFPSDQKLREDYFDPEAMKHPAKFNLHMMTEIVKFVSEPGDTVMDVFGGTGSLMLAAAMGRRVVLIDVEEKYCNLQRRSAEVMDMIEGGVFDKVTIIEGSNLKILPLPCDHIITSPPYASIMRRKIGDKGFTEKDMAKDTKMWSALGEHLLEYSQSPDNIGNLNEFFYSHTMERVYKLCYDSLPPGGTMTVVIKDHIRNNKRVYFSDWVIRRCINIGFEQYAWFKWKAPGSPFLQIRRAKGFETVEDEDIVIVQKPILAPTWQPSEKAIEMLISGEPLLVTA